MAKRLCAERLVKAGFLLTTCPDGKFWVFEQEPGEEANHTAAICAKVLEDVDSTTVAENLVLQCDSDYKNPAFYMDGFLWNLPQREFSEIVEYLIKSKKK